MSEAKQGIVDLLTRIGDPNIVFQNLDHCMRGAQSIKGGATEIRFGTEAVTATELMLGNEERMALILWVKRSDVQAARDAFAAGMAATSSAIDTAVNDQMRELGDQLKDVGHKLEDQSR